VALRRFGSKRGASKWRCPSGECKPASRWVKADRLHPLIPRESPRWWKLYKGRASVEREFGRLKNEWALLPLRVRGLDRVALHADLTILAKLSRFGSGSGRARHALAATLAPEMEGGEHSSREPTVSVKVPCQECGGLGYIQRVKEGHVVGDKTKKCRTCRGRGLIPNDMPISQLRELLK
jgi:Transposase DDE domain